VEKPDKLTTQNRSKVTRLTGWNWPPHSGAKWPPLSGLYWPPLKKELFHVVEAVFSRFKKNVW